MKELYEEILKYNERTIQKTQDILSNLNSLYFKKLYFNGEKEYQSLIEKNKHFLNKKTKNIDNNNPNDEAKCGISEEETNKSGEKKEILEDKINLQDDFHIEIKNNNQFDSGKQIEKKNSNLSDIKINNEENLKIFSEIACQNNSNSNKEIIINNPKINFKLSHKDYVRIKKNNKMVYINSNSTLSENKNNLKVNRVIFAKSTKRGSKYRGVSKNGNLWQVLIMHKKHNFYIGSFSSEEIAARVYDIKSYELKGNNAKTNFVYSEKELEIIRKIDVNSKDINETISRVFISKKEY